MSETTRRLRARMDAEEAVRRAEVEAEQARLRALPRRVVRTTRTAALRWGVYYGEGRDERYAGGWPTKAMAAAYVAVWHREGGTDATIERARWLYRQIYSRALKAGMTPGDAGRMAAWTAGELGLLPAHVGADPDSGIPE